MLILDLQWGHFQFSWVMISKYDKYGSIIYLFICRSCDSSIELQGKKSYLSKEMKTRFCWIWLWWQITPAYKVRHAVRIRDHIHYFLVILKQLLYKNKRQYNCLERVCNIRYILIQWVLVTIECNMCFWANHSLDNSEDAFLIT